MSLPPSRSRVPKMSCVIRVKTRPFGAPKQTSLVSGTKKQRVTPYVIKVDIFKIIEGNNKKDYFKMMPYIRNYNYLTGSKLSDLVQIVGYVII